MSTAMPTFDRQRSLPASTRAGTRYLRPRATTALPAAVLGLCFGIWGSTAVAQEVLRLDPDRGVHSVLGHQYVLTDPGGRLDFTGIRARDDAFRRVARVPGLRYQHAALWLRFTVAGTTEVGEAWLLHVDNKSLDEVTLFRETEEGWQDVVHTGDARPFGTREIRDRSFYFHLPVSETPRTYYLRAASKGPLYVPLSIVQQSAYWSAARTRTLLMGIFFGILLVMALYHLVLYLSIRDVAYLYYVLFIVALLLYVVSVERVGLEYLWPDAVWWAERANTVLGLAAVLAGIVFSRSFLDVQHYDSRWNRALIVAATGAMGLMVVNMIGMIGWVIYVTIAYILLCLTLLLATGFVVHRRGNTSAKFYLIAWSFLFVGVLVWTLGYLHVLEPTGLVRSYGVQMGASLEVVLFALGLGHRYNEMRTGRERLRVRIASDLHDDVGSSLTGIALAGDRLALAVDGTAASAAREIAGRARFLSHVMRDIIWAQEPEQKNWESLELRMKDYAVELLEENGIAFEFETDGPPPPTKPSDAVQQNLIHLFKEAVHNAVKHGACSRVAVQQRYERERLRLRISDDGKGFDVRTHHSGMGVKGMRRRAAAMNAEIDLTSSPDGGTSVELSIPVERQHVHSL